MTEANGPTVVVIVLDAFGVTTLDYLLGRHDGEIQLPNLSRLGLGNLLDARHHSRIPPNPNAQFAAAVEQVSASADSVIGHREMVGVIDPTTYDLFPDGFPANYIRELERRIGSFVLFNKMAGGSEAIAKNWQQHMATSYPIVYASVCDPAIQIAMDEAVIGIEDQHTITEEAFRVAQEMDVRINRAIGRSYVMLSREGEGKFKRTANRHDVVLPLTQPTLVDILREQGVHTVAVAKVGDLVTTTFSDTIKVREGDYDASNGFRFVHPDRADTNPYSLQGTVMALQAAQREQRPNGTFIFTNLVDTDAVWGHTRLVEGALRCVEEVDRSLPTVMSYLRPGDIFMVTADHGMEHRSDYGYHHKEPVPLLAVRMGSDRLGLSIGRGKTMADVGYLAAQAFGCKKEFVQRCGLGPYLP